MLVCVENMCLIFGSGFNLENFGCSDLLLKIRLLSIIGEISVISIMFVMSGSSVIIVVLISKIICFRIRLGLFIIW